MILIATLVIMAACAWAQYRNGLFTSVTMLIMVLISGVVAFGFWEPIADLLDPIFLNNALAGCEDMIMLVVLFSATLFGLRLLASYINPDLIEEHGTLQHFGGAGVGLIIGYFVAGFLTCVMQTLPLDENFMDFAPRTDHEAFHRAFLPGDRVWLAMMRHAGAAPLNWKDDPNPTGVTLVDRSLTFDRNATFELRYLRYRRSTDTRPVMPYFGEFEKELGRSKLK